MHLKLQTTHLSSELIIRCNLPHFAFKYKETAILRIQRVLLNHCIADGNVVSNTICCLTGGTLPYVITC